MKNNILTNIFLIACMSILPALSLAQDWPSYGGDNGSSKYKPFDQINADNVVNLAQAWSWDSVDNATVADNLAAVTLLLYPQAGKPLPLWSMESCISRHRLDE